MKNLSVYSLLLGCLLLAFPLSDLKGQMAPRDQQVKNLEAFTRLYGYIRYFHPSDEASAVDWDKFLYYGIEQVLDDKDSLELVETLADLFLPVAPSLNLVVGEEILPRDKPVPGGDDHVWVSWQHKGLGNGQNSIYQSVRLGRLDPDAPRSYGLSREIPPSNIEGRSFTLDVILNSTEAVDVEVEIAVYNAYKEVKRASQQFTLTGKDFEDPIHLEGKFESGDEYPTLDIRLLGTGTAQLSGAKLKLEETEGLEAVTLQLFDAFTHSGWDLPSAWEPYGYGYEYSIIEEEVANPILIKHVEGAVPGALFKHTAQPEDWPIKYLGSGIKCRFPLALRLPKEVPETLDEHFVRLEQKLEKLRPEVNAADSFATRVAAVIQTWNAFRYFYPYFDVVDVNWDEMLLQSLDEILASTSRKDLQYVLQKMTETLGDGHISVRSLVPDASTSFGPFFSLFYLCGGATGVHRRAGRRLTMGGYPAGTGRHIGSNCPASPYGPGFGLPSVENLPGNVLFCAERFSQCNHSQNRPGWGYP